MLHWLYKDRTEKKKSFSFKVHILFRHIKMHGILSNKLNIFQNSLRSILIILISINIMLDILKTERIFDNFIVFFYFFIVRLIEEFIFIEYKELRYDKHHSYLLFLYPAVFTVIYCLYLLLGISIDTFVATEVYQFLASIYTWN